MAIKADEGIHAVGNAKEDRVYGIIINFVMILFSILILYPLVYVVSASLSNVTAVQQGRVILWPVDVSFDGYTTIFRNEWIGIGYMNTIFYTVTGTVINVFFTLVCAYPLARPNLKGSGFIMILFTITMFFSGGMIPNFMLMNFLKIYNTRWAVLLPGFINVYNMIIARTFMRNGLPPELLEASQIDGCSDAGFFFKIALPLSKPIIAVLVLYYGVGHWNSYFNAMLYLSDKRMMPLQIFLREILIANQITENLDPDLVAARTGLADLLKYTLIVVSSAPIMILYPLLQKYFAKGVMIGSVKG